MSKPNNLLPFLQYSCYGYTWVKNLNLKEPTLQSGLFVPPPFEQLNAASDQLKKIKALYANIFFFFFWKKPTHPNTLEHLELVAPNLWSHIKEDISGAKWMRSLITIGMYLFPQEEGGGCIPALGF